MQLRLSSLTLQHQRHPYLDPVGIDQRRGLFFRSKILATSFSLLSPSDRLRSKLFNIYVHNLTSKPSTPICWLIVFISNFYTSNHNINPIYIFKVTFAFPDTLFAHQNFLVRISCFTLRWNLIHCQQWLIVLLTWRIDFFFFFFNTQMILSIMKWRIRAKSIQELWQNRKSKVKLPHLKN